MPALRFRVGEGVVAFDDIVRGRVEIDVANLGGDFVIVRADGTPLYHFTVVVDDAAMRISHVIRGEDHLSNTPKHILLFRALGEAVPQFAHLPLILNADRTKMSKRKSQTAHRRLHRPRASSARGWSTTSPCSAGRPGRRRRSSGSTSSSPGSSSRPSTRAGRCSTASDSSGSTVSGSGASRRTSSSTGCGRSWRRDAARRTDRPDARPTTRSGRSCRSSRSGCRSSARSAISSASCSSTGSTSTGAARAEALGRGDDPRGPGRRARRRSPIVRPVAFEADELEPPLRGLAEAARLEGRRPVHGDPGRGHRPDGDAAAVRHARRARSGAHAWPGSTRRSRRSIGRSSAEPVTGGMPTR